MRQQRVIPGKSINTKDKEKRFNISEKIGSKKYAKLAAQCNKIILEFQMSTPKLE